MSRRVVISGLGGVSAFGVGFAALWEGLDGGRCALAVPNRLDASGFGCHLAGEVKDFSAKDFVPKHYRKAVKVMARDTEIAVASAKMAVEDAKLVTRSHGDGETPAPGAFASERMGCQIGAGLIAAETQELASALVTARPEDASPEAARRGGFELRSWGTINGGGGGMNNLQPLWLLKYLPNMLACHVTIIHGAEGPSNTITCGEASGLLSAGESFRVIQRGSADLCFSGGAESKVSLMGFLRAQLAGRLATTAPGADAAAVVRPYDPESPGTVPGEGGGILILEEAASAASRGARAYAEVLGFGAAQSTPFIPPMTRPDRGVANDGLEYAIRAAMREAGVGPGEIDAVVPQALGVPDYDGPEALALRAVLGKRLDEIPAITLCPAIGDCSAGHGALQLGVAALALAHQRVPARLHAGRPVGLNAGAAGASSTKLRRVLVCSSSQGGQNAAVVLGRAPGAEGGKD